MCIRDSWDPEDDTQDLFKLEDADTLTSDTVAPTATTVPTDDATAIALDSALTATFSEVIREQDIKDSNFRLIDTTDYSIVAGALTYSPSTKVVTFTPTSDLTTAVEYVWSIGGVRDLAGNEMTAVSVAFTTA